MSAHPFLLAAFLLVIEPTAHASDATFPLSAARINHLDQRGYITPRCRKALVDLVQTREALDAGRIQDTRLKTSLPSLQEEQRVSASQVEDLKKQLASYEHPEDDDFAALQGAAADSSASLEKKLDLAQAFIWSYPADPRQAEAVQNLQRWQKELSNSQQATAATVAKQVAIREQLLRRVKSHDLTLHEWQLYLNEMSQEDLLAKIGPPSSRGSEIWNYPGPWTWDPTTGARAGLLIHFNGTRVSRVSASGL